MGDTITSIVNEIAAEDPSIHESPKNYPSETRNFSLDHKINWSWTDFEFAELVANPFHADSAT